MNNIKVIHLVFIMILILICAQSGKAQALSENALLQRRIFADPDIWHLTKSYANSEWGVDLYAYPTSVSMVYFTDSSGYAHSVMSFTSDYAFHRIVYSEAYLDWIRAYGSFGSSIGQFNSPSGIVAFNRTDGDWENHHIYVADTWNNRICGFTYDWSSQAINSPYEITGGGLVLPKDLDINNGGEFGDPNNDRLWVANGDNTIKKFDLNGNLLLEFGYFEDLRGIACGRSYFTDPPPPYEHFANNNYIYILEGRYIHKYYENPPGNIQYERSVMIGPPCDPPCPWPERMTSIDVDNVGQVWTTVVDTQNEVSRIDKYTPDLDFLCSFNAGGIFNRLRSFSDAGGKWGCGNVIVLEEWSNESGALYYWIGTDILNYSTGSDEEHGHHYAAYTLVDPALISVKVYNEGGSLIKTVKDTIPHVLNFSGWENYWWDGYDNSGQIAPSGNYRIEATAYSAYLNRGTGGHANTVSKDGWVYHCSSAPNAPSNLNASNSAGCDARITLNWQDNSNNEDGFNIYRDGQVTGSVGANVTTFTQTGLNPGQTYSYYVKANKQGCESGASNTVNQTPGPFTPVAPTNLQVVNIGDCGFRATWNDNSNNEDGFALYNGEYWHATLPANTESFEGNWYPETEWVRQSDFYVYANDGSCKAYSNHVVMDPPGGVIAAPSNCELHGPPCDLTATWQNNDNNVFCQVRHYYTGCDIPPWPCMNWWYQFDFFASCGGTSIPHPSGCGCACVKVRGGKWVNCGGGYVRKWSNYSNSSCLSTIICNEPPNGCPYLFVYNEEDEKFLGENTILAPVEMAKDRTLDVDDYCLLKQSVTPIDNMYKLKIGEFEQEHSFFDQVELWAIDHEFGSKVAVTRDGKLFVYNPTNFLEPISCYDEKGANQDSLLQLDPEDRALLAGSGSLVLDFGQAPQDSTPQILLLPCCGNGNGNSKVFAKVVDGQVTPQVGLLVEVEKDGFWQEIDSIPPRLAQGEFCIDLSNVTKTNQELKIKLSWDERGYSFSKLSCFQAKQLDQPKPLGLISASHSKLGDVAQKLTFDDNDYVELLPGEEIDLSFSHLSIEPGKVRDFVFKSNGYYITDNLAKATTTPSSQELQQNYPNPFNPQTQIEFSLAKPSKVSLVIYNLLGQTVITLLDKTLPPGKHVINWNGGDESGQKVASGIYFYRLQAGEYNEIRKMVIVK